ncbi:MAG: ornithine cyclodeaminase family protein [Deltaproteobacteria bacterium]|nr:ornithine cyclodeaminase family protein [Deltaproteobacteria bacterium]
MTLILTNEEIESCFTLEECFRVMEPAFIDLGNGAAANLPRQDLLVPGPLEDSYHGLKAAGGSMPRFGVTAARLTSDIVTWPEVDGQRRRVKVPLAMGNKYVGLVLLFSTATGELLAIFPDGLVQAIRVGVTNALSAKYMARPESSVLGIYGSGWQARSGLLAMCAAMPIREVRVYSPTEQHRRAFAREMDGRVEADVRAVDVPEHAAHGADIVLMTTNALVPFFPEDWIHEGMHIATVRSSEMALDALLRCDRLVVSSREAARLVTLPGEEERIPEAGEGDYRREELSGTEADWSRKPELGEVMAGKVAGREGEAEVTCMLNYVGLGLQFAAAGARIYELARERSLGRDLPTEWFSQDLHS